MTDRRPRFADLCAHAAGTRPWSGAPLDPAAERELALARAIVEAGRAVRDDVRAGPRRRRLALRAFRERHGGLPRPLRVVADSNALATAAVRTPATGRPRLVRLRGEGLAVQLHLARARDGFDVHGEIDPADATAEVLLTAGERTLRATVDERGEFQLRAVPRMRWTLRIGDHLLESFEP